MVTITNICDRLYKLPHLAIQAEVRSQLGKQDQSARFVSSDGRAIVQNPNTDIRPQLTASFSVVMYDNGQTNN